MLKRAPHTLNPFFWAGLRKWNQTRAIPLYKIAWSPKVIYWRGPQPPHDWRWSLHNNRNKVHNECVVLESSPNHHASQSMEKSSSLKLVPGAKKIGDHCSLYSNSRALSSFLGCMCLCSNFCALWRKNEKMRQKGE